MSWKSERDALIAQTMAFVHSVTGRTESATPAADDFGPSAPEATSVPSRPPENAFSMQQEVVPAPKARTTAPTMRPDLAVDMATEIRARIAGFRAHQERFNREREEYFSETLARLKAEINEMPRPRLGK